MKKRYAIITTLLLTAFLAGCQEAKNGGSAMDSNEETQSSMLEADAEFPEAILEKSSADTAILVSNNGQVSWDIQKVEEIVEPINETAQELEELMTSFGQTYFNGDIDTIEKFLVNDYQWGIETFEFTAQADIVGINGLQQIDEQQLLDHYELSMQFRFPGEDSLTYLSVAWEKEGDDWKVSGYGLEK